MLATGESQEADVGKVQTFAEWFDAGWRRDGEKATPALFRMSVETGLAPMTIRRALQGKPIRTDTAVKLAAITRGSVSRDSLAFGSAATATAPEAA